MFTVELGNEVNVQQKTAWMGMRSVMDGRIKRIGIIVAVDASPWSFNFRE